MHTQRDVSDTDHCPGISSQTDKHSAMRQAIKHTHAHTPLKLLMARLLVYQKHTLLLKTGENSILSQQYYVTTFTILKNMKNNILNVAFRL
jgi:hypothetical protein